MAAAAAVKTLGDCAPSTLSKDDQKRKEKKNENGTLSCTFQDTWNRRLGRELLSIDWELSLRGSVSRSLNSRGITEQIALNRLN